MDVRDRSIRSIQLTETLQRDEDAELTSEELEEAKQLLKDEQLKRSDPDAWNKLRLERSQAFTQSQRDQPLAMRVNTPIQPLGLPSSSAVASGSLSRKAPTHAPPIVPRPLNGKTTGAEELSPSQLLPHGIPPFRPIHQSLERRADLAAPHTPVVPSRRDVKKVPDVPRPTNLNGPAIPVPQENGPNGDGKATTENPATKGDNTRKAQSLTADVTHFLNKDTEAHGKESARKEDGASSAKPTTKAKSDKGDPSHPGGAVPSGHPTESGKSP